MSDAASETVPADGPTVATEPAVTPEAGSAAAPVETQPPTEALPDPAGGYEAGGYEAGGYEADPAGDPRSRLKDRAGDVVDRASAATGRIAAQVVDRLRNNAELAAERGSTTIADEVVGKIVGIAAREVPGVYDLGGDVARVFAAVKQKIGLGEASESNQGVKVRLDGRSAGIDITIVIEYGFVIYSVTEKVRTKVIAAVENLLGLAVTEVNIVVDDVHVREDGAAGDGEAS